MREEINGKIFMEKNSSFNISEILECGQCFRFEKIGESEYEVIAKNRIISIKQDTSGVWFDGTSREEFDLLWLDYFDLNVDYCSIKDTLSADGHVMKSAIDYAGGIRLLNQEPWECLISFIISQNNQIPQIKQVIKNISERYGSKLGDNKYAFPTPKELIDVPVDGFKECKAGFRANYIRDAVVKVYTGELNFEELKLLETNIVREKLMGLKGVGPKVSDCVMLFSMGRREVFPVDVWVGKIMQRFYFENEKPKLKDIHSFARSKFAENAGYAQQYLFYYARSTF